MMLYPCCGARGGGINNQGSTYADNSAGEKCRTNKSALIIALVWDYAQMQPPGLCAFAT
jgi:hypothetical protein